MDKQALLAEIKDAIFPSKEDDGIEHVDFSYEEFMQKLDELAA